MARPIASADTTTQTALAYNKQSNKLSLDSGNAAKQNGHDGTAVAAKFITPLDPVIETADGSRLPAIPVEEAHKLNALKERLDSKETLNETEVPEIPATNKGPGQESDPCAQDGNLDITLPPTRTHPLFPPLPLYGPPSLLRKLQCLVLRTTSFFLSSGFLLVIVLGAVFTSIPKIIQRLWLRMTFRNPDKKRPFYEEEQKRARARAEEERIWLRKQNAKRSRSNVKGRSVEPSPAPESIYEPLEGGKDKLVCDVRYYARRVGLDVEELKVQTEDGFVIDLWHVYNPKENTPAEPASHGPDLPSVFLDGRGRNSRNHLGEKKRRYPVLLMHGLLQSSGAFCCSDDDSLAFYLHKSGYDVWLGNNRCGFTPQHTLLGQIDPRMWAWNIRQMGVLDLPALVSRVLFETGFEKLGLIAHSQGTTQTFVALAKEQRPDLGDRISVFCALAPAVYAGPLIGKMYFKFMRVISPAMFRVFFGIHAFIPQMMVAHRHLPGKLYGAMGYLVFSFLFNWSDKLWDKGLRDRAFQFAPVYVSSESMRWWLGRECFAKHKCILSTREQGRAEENEDSSTSEDNDTDHETEHDHGAEIEQREKRESERPAEVKGKTAWYDEHVPPMALWIGGSDELVDGQRLLRRFERGREPHVKLVHKKVIPEYEHLDVLWAIDSIAQVGSEVKDVVWRTMSEEDRQRCHSIEGTQNLETSEKAL